VTRDQIVLAVTLPPSLRDRLENVARVVDVSDDTESEASSQREVIARVRAALPPAAGLICDANLPVDAGLIEASSHLRIIATASVGFDHIDLVAAAQGKVIVTNTPGLVDEATAEIAWVLVVMLMRGIPTATAHVRSGAWGRNAAPALTPGTAGNILGIVGMGGVGSALARRARDSGMHIVYHNRKPRADDERMGARYLSFRALLTQADVVAATMPLTAQTREIFNGEAFATMKPGAFFVNVARGGVVETDALRIALERGHLAGAGLDVVEPEPIPCDHPLLAAPNLIVLPHVGTATTSTRNALLASAVDNVLAVLSGLAPISPVVFGQVPPRETEGPARGKDMSVIQ
jgi:glyoxylate reductase